jgi:hypothetical protein
MEDDKPWLEHRWNRWEVTPGYGKELVVNVGADTWVEVDKLYGPQSSSSIRVKHDLESCQWVVEEQNFNNNEWVERARFDAQEFYKDKYQEDGVDYE